MRLMRAMRTREQRVRRGLRRARRNPRGRAVVRQRHTFVSILPTLVPPTWAVCLALLVANGESILRRQNDLERYAGLSKSGKNDTRLFPL